MLSNVCCNIMGLLDVRCVDVSTILWSLDGLDFLLIYAMNFPEDERFVCCLDS